MGPKKGKSGKGKGKKAEAVVEEKKEEPKPPEPLRPANLGFAFDLVIVKVDLKSPKVEDQSKLKVNAKFIDQNITITSSRINVTQFRPGCGVEMSELATVFKDKLAKSPLTCEVLYSDKSVGSATFIWPESFINCIGGNPTCGRELTHCEKADIMSGEKEVGSIDIIAKLVVKCQEFDINSIKPKELRTCDQGDGVINPNDIMFTVSANRYGSVDCPDLEVIPGTESSAISSPHATCLDLSDFRRINGKTVSNTDIFESMEVKCCQKEKPTNQFQEIMNQFAATSRESDSCCSSPKRSHNFQSILKNPEDSAHNKRFASCSSSESYNHPFVCNSDEIEPAANNTRHRKLPPLKPPKRFCPMCNENATWLPRHATCPKCGFKPIPYDLEPEEEVPYDYDITADKLIQDFDEKKSRPHCSSNDSLVVGESQQCRCTCSKGKICTHCRIRKLCEDIFKPVDKGDGDCGKCLDRSSELYNVCKGSSQDCRPYLTKVFQELRGLYELNGTNKDSGDSVDICNVKEEKENVFNGNFKKEVPRQEVPPSPSTSDPFSQVKSGKKNLDKERDKFLVKKFQKHESCKGKRFNYKTKREYPGFRIGHKTCLNGFAGRKNVPSHMGWLWTAGSKSDSRVGWKPGAIRKPIKMLMQHFLNFKSSRTLGKDCGDQDNDEAKDPTLHICKKDGIYYITLSPLESMDSTRECTEPRENMRRIQFVIRKNPLLMEMRSLKGYLKKCYGFAKCTCHKPIASCCCRSFLDRKKLEYICCKECYKRQIPNCNETLILSDTSESEAEFEFGITAPAATTPKLQKKRKKVSTATQYVKDDWECKPDYPKPVEKYKKLHNCAVGNRYGPAFGPYGITGFVPGAPPAEGVLGPCGIIAQNLFGAGAVGGDMATFAAMGGFAGRGGVGGMGGSGGMGGKGFGNAFKGNDGKFNMAAYIQYKNLTKPSPQELAERKRQKMARLKGANPPLLCMVDRRGKQLDVCAPCAPCIPCDPACSRDNRIC